MFEPCGVHRFALEKIYTAEEYRGLLLTYSDVLALPARRREGLVNCLTDLIRFRCGGKITKHDLATLQLWRRRTES